MPTNKEHLIQAIKRYKTELIETAANRLQKLDSSHYEMIDYESHLEREEAFLNALLQGLREDPPVSLITFVEQLTAQRLEEGYSLEEFQEAFNIVEETLWDTLVKHFSCDASLVGMLTIGRKFFRTAKDHIARVYLREALLARRELEQLRRKFRNYRKMTRKSLP